MAELTYNIKEAAKAIGVSRPTMYKLIYLEGFPAWRVGNRWRIPRRELADWLAQQANERAQL